MSISNLRIAVIGELNVDLIMDQLKGEPEYGKEQIATKMNLVMGSSSAIYACNSAALGASVSFSGMIGDDTFGTFVKNSLQEKGVIIDHVRTNKTGKTGITVALNKGNERLMVTHPGVMEMFGRQDIDPVFFQSADHLHLSSIFFQPQIKRDLLEILKAAKESGLTTSMDVQWDPDETWNLDLNSLLSYVDLFMPNEVEFLNLTGAKTINDALNSVSNHETTFVIKRGKKGSLLFRDEQKLTQNAFSLDGFSDAIGAGDSFNAGFIYAFLQEKPLSECLKQGSITAAVSTLKPGGTGAIQSYQQVQSYLEQK